MKLRQHIIVACDVEGSTSRTNPAKMALRLDIDGLLEDPGSVRDPSRDGGSGCGWPSIRVKFTSTGGVCSARTST